MHVRVRTYVCVRTYLCTRPMQRRNDFSRDTRRGICPVGFSVGSPRLVRCSGLIPSYLITSLQVAERERARIGLRAVSPVMNLATRSSRTP